MCSFFGGALSTIQAARVAEFQAQREMEHAKRMRAGSRTPYQDELAAQLDRCRAQQLELYETRWFYCAGYRWQASVRIQ